MTILVTNNILFCKFVSKLVTIVINNFLLLKLVVNVTFSCYFERENRIGCGFNSPADKY